MLYGGVDLTSDVQSIMKNKGLQSICHGMAGFNSFRGGGSLPDSKDRGITEK